MRVWAGLALMMVWASEARAQPVDRSRFVQVEGAHFTLEGRPFRFVGANASIMHGRHHRESVEATLDAVARDGLKVVRVWALGEQPEGAEAWTWDYAFRLGPEGWIERSFQHLDHVLTAARERNLRVIVVLANRWSDYGGAPRYLAWAGVTPLGDRLAAPPGGALARFFDHPTAQSLYRAHVWRVVSRIHAVTGVAYRDDPTIMAWELINEAEAPRGEEAALLQWTRESARYLHTLDPVHLVSAGHIGYTRQDARAAWLAVQSLSEIDYADAHAYPTELASVPTMEALDDFIDDHLQLAHHVVHKPFVWGEFGFGARGPVERGHTREDWYRRFLARSSDDGADGTMAWIYTVTDPGAAGHRIAIDTDVDRAVRSAMAEAARRPMETVATNARLGETVGTAPLWATRRVVRGPATIAPGRRVGRGVVWSIAPEQYAALEGENLGRWDGYAVMHVYANGDAAMAYRVRGVANVRARHLRVRFRASSELPGRGEGSTPRDVSHVRVTLDGVVVGETNVATDDGVGRWAEVVSDDPQVIARLTRGGVHSLRLEVPPGELAHGLCLYGHATGREPVPAGAGALPGRVQVVLEP